MGYEKKKIINKQQTKRLLFCFVLFYNPILMNTQKISIINIIEKKTTQNLQTIPLKTNNQNIEKETLYSGANMENRFKIYIQCGISNNRNRSIYNRSRERDD